MELCGARVAIQRVALVLPMVVLEIQAAACIVIWILYSAVNKIFHNNHDDFKFIAFEVFIGT